MATLSERLVALSRRAGTDPALRDALVEDAGSVLAEQRVALPDGVTARAEYHEGYGLYIELNGPGLGSDAEPATSPPAGEQSTLDCLHH